MKSRPGGFCIVSYVFHNADKGDNLLNLNLPRLSQSSLSFRCNPVESPLPGFGVDAFNQMPLAQFDEFGAHI